MVVQLCPMMAPRQFQHGYVGEVDRLDKLEAHLLEHECCDVPLPHDSSSPASCTTAHSMQYASAHQDGSTASTTVAAVAGQQSTVQEAGMQLASEDNVAGDEDDINWKVHMNGAIRRWSQHGDESEEDLHLLDLHKRHELHFQPSTRETTEYHKRQACDSQQQQLQQQRLNEPLEQDDRMNGNLLLLQHQFLQQQLSPVLESELRVSGAALLADDHIMSDLAYQEGDLQAEDDNDHCSISSDDNIPVVSSPSGQLSLSAASPAMISAARRLTDDSARMADQSPVGSSRQAQQSLQWRGPAKPKGCKDICAV